MNYRTVTETGSVPLIVGFVLAGGALGAAQFVSLSLNASSIRTAVFPERVRVTAQLEGAAATIYDPQAGTFLYAKNEETQLPLASLTKVMTAAMVLASADQDKPVRIDAGALHGAGDLGPKLGETWSLENLVTFGLVASSNDAIAAAAASTIGGDILESMNNEAKRLGLAQTYFLDSIGLDLTPQTAGAYGSARDMAILMASFLKRYPHILEATARNHVPVGHSLEVESTSVPIHDIPGLIGAKTGFTRLSGGNLVAAFDADIGRPLIAVVLGSSEEGRFEDMRALIGAAKASVAAAAVSPK